MSGHVSEDVVAGNNTLILACHVSPRVMQCPSRLHLMSCYSDFISPFGSLPVQCYPDAAAHIEEAESLGLTGSPREVTRPMKAVRTLTLILNVRLLYSFITLYFVLRSERPFMP